MSNNSFITKEGLEIGTAQALQAHACKIPPASCMNPILLKPNSDTGSQVIVNGLVYGNMTAVEYYRNKQIFIPEILKAYKKLSDNYEAIVIEGAGSPAEINLKENDIVNMGLAKLVMNKVIEDSRAAGRKGIVLTCKDGLRMFYSDFGYEDEGISQSNHGDTIWYKMRLTF